MVIQRSVEMRPRSFWVEQRLKKRALRSLSGKR